MSQNKMSSAINIRKVTADFNNFFLETKGNKERTQKDGNKEDIASGSSQVVEDSKNKNAERRESYASECESELRDIIINEI